MPAAVARMVIVAPLRITIPAALLVGAAAEKVHVPAAQVVEVSQTVVAFQSAVVTPVRVRKQSVGAACADCGIMSKNAVINNEVKNKFRIFV